MDVIKVKTSSWAIRTARLESDVIVSPLAASSAQRLCKNKRALSAVSSSKRSQKWCLTVRFAPVPNQKGFPLYPSEFEHRHLSNAMHLDCITKRDFSLRV